MRVRARRELRLEGLLRLPVIEPGNPRLPSLQPLQHLRQVPVRRRPRHNRHIRRPLEDLLALLLRHAPQHGELLALALHPLVLVQPVEDLLLRLIADRAGVVQNQASRRLVLHLGIPLLLQRPNDFFAVMGVHLAAEGFDIKRFAHSPSISPPAPMGEPRPKCSEA